MMDQPHKECDRDSRRGLHVLLRCPLVVSDRYRNKPPNQVNIYHCGADQSRRFLIEQYGGKPSSSANGRSHRLVFLRRG